MSTEKVRNEHSHAYLGGVNARADQNVASRAASQAMRTIAAFDLDGTLTHGDSLWRFLIRLRGPKAVLRAAMATSTELLQSALFGGEAADRAKEAIFARLLAGQALEEVAALGAVFASELLEKRSRPEIVAQAARHRAAGHQLAVVSASPEVYVSHVAKLLGASITLATRLEVNTSGLLTGHILGRNCRGPEKAARMLEWINSQGEAREDLWVWAYGNSAGDSELLAMADCAVNVGRLGSCGKLARRVPDAHVRPGVLRSKPLPQ